ncbi:unnamed protein product [Parnassius apollo]|uniref:(apollo) hypothetical protein n=1 Tax=Parnassius apollo TaxID=110799 RepID=A0A8S3WV58_PARAO|nr:unnamed protein product [Parnassius apollo]
MYILCFLFLVILCLITLSEAYPLKSENIDYLEALRRMKQIPQWHCMRYRRFQLHSPCSRWWLMRRL